jgi:hypothetical protein
MDQREVLKNELQAIITASKPFVKRLRERNSHIQAGHFTNLSIQSRKLAERNDMLLPTYRRYVDRMIEEFNYQVSLAYDKHPDLKKLVKRSSKVLDDPKEPTKALKVSITLPVHEWLFVDESIKNGFAQSRSEYFRKLHISRRR